MTASSGGDDSLTYADAERRGKHNAALAESMRDHILQTFGSTTGFLRQLRITSINAADTTALAAFHFVLSTGILPDELVPIDEFVAALGPKNADPVFQQALGPFRYFALGLSAPGHGMIAAAGFAVFCHRQGPATIHASYYGVLPAFRGLGTGNYLVNVTAGIAVEFIAHARPMALRTGSVVEFIEANEMSSMTLADRLLDEAIAIHPLVRDAFWEHLGFRELLHIEYRQRSETPIGLALKALLIDVTNGSEDVRVGGLTPPAGIPGSLLLRHVSAFDNLLMNYDEARNALGSDQKLPDPRTAGLLAWFDPNRTIPVKSLQQAGHDRRMWAGIDQRLRHHEADLAHDQTLQVLRDNLKVATRRDPG